MNDPVEKPLLEDLRAEMAALAGEFGEMASARWELARLEIAADLRSVRRLAIRWLVAAAAAVAVLPLLAVALAGALAGCGGIGMAGWLLLVAAGMSLLAIVIAWFAWRRFRRNFVGLRETFEELGEDLVWLNEKRECRETPE
ncbi:MAG: phage holin family protein [Planctomycetaceae bacterium]|nr:phage holin family protein [Planctomycetaceae bacterium]